MNCKDCIHEGVCWKQHELLSEWEWDEAQECCEDKNLFMKLPCKVGDTVYVLDILADNCKCADCDYYYAGGMGDTPECEKTRHGYRYHKCIEIIEEPALMQSILCWLSCDDFGKTVFLTKEEAEKALAERKRNERKK